MRYRSRVTLLGLPLVEVALGPASADPRGPRAPGVAKAWIAIGDVAFGAVFAAGGVAIGAVGVGGVSVGLLAFAGLAAGLWALGGLAVGVLAFGGAAVGYSAALGGLALARDYALGGFAAAAHANDAAARAFFATGRFFSWPTLLAEHRDWLIAAVGGALAVAWIFKAEEHEA
ncbi:MAG TPA: hypothetical protein VFV10_05165 [Gammaproteobacteria bacterium]|nr:hypothetical protein [Gammaproteobacteria bacterium]